MKIYKMLKIKVLSVLINNKIIIMSNIKIKTYLQIQQGKIIIILIFIIII